MAQGGDSKLCARWFIQPIKAHSSYIYVYMSQRRVELVIIFAIVWEPHLVEI
jgi:hypothetical protein